MRLLLDTQTLLWWREGNRRLGPRARAAIEREAAAVVGQRRQRLGDRRQVADRSAASARTR